MTTTLPKDKPRASSGLLRPRNGVLALSGYGVRVVVERGHLYVDDGIGIDRRRGRFSRVGSAIKRVVVLGHSGIISFDALRWLHDIGVSFVQIDADGQVIVASGPSGLDDARLRRAQALAFSNGAALEIARDLIGRKLMGQLAVLDRLRDREATSAIRNAIDKLPLTTTLDGLRQTEAQAASAYWGAWRYIDVVFKHRDADRVPEHWRAFGVRKSLLTLNPRKATNPANAILNYLYAILEAEARIAALAAGLDPAIGIMHADLRARDSFACDLMEAVRPKVDLYVLGLLESRAFKKSDFFETREGICRIMPPLTHQLAETGALWVKELAPVTERVAQELFASARDSTNITGASTSRASKTTVLPTPLTETNRSAGREKYRRRPEPKTVDAMRAWLFS